MKILKEYMCSPFSQLNESKKAYEHEQQTVKDKDDTGVDFKAAFLLPDLSHSDRNQDLSNNKYAELDRKMNMYKKEIEQLKDEKKVRSRRNELNLFSLNFIISSPNSIQNLAINFQELEQTVSDMGKDREALRLELIEKIEVEQSLNLLILVF